MLALIEEIGGELVAMAQEWAQTESVGPDEARRRLGAFVEFHARNGPLVHAVAEAARHDEVVEQAYDALVEGFVAITARAIEARVQSGELAPLDAPEIARALIRMLNGYLEDTFGRRVGEVEPERALEVVWTIWTRTLFPSR
jgi:AcrR family transcriptional regulator